MEDVLIEDSTRSGLDPRRASYVTGSDVPAICGENGFPGANWSGVMRKKVLKLPHEDTPATLWGKQHEPIAIADFCATYDATPTYLGFVLHKKYGWFGGTVDAIVCFNSDVKIPYTTSTSSRTKTDDSSGGGGVTMKAGSKAVLEVKCPKSRYIREGEMPGQYIGQLQSYLEICDMENGIFLDYRPAGPRSAKKMMVLHVKRDRVYMSLRLPYLKKWWDEFNATSAYVNAVVTCIQRTWKCYLARKRMNTAIDVLRATTGRMGCANTIGKIAGFLKKKEVYALDREALCDLESKTASRFIVWVSLDGFEERKRLWRRNGRRQTTIQSHDGRRGGGGGVCVVSFL
jgi:hypothetical protein